MINKFPYREYMDNEDLRVSYLLNEIDYDVWVEKLKRRQKVHEKNNMINQILKTAIASLIDIFTRFSHGDYDTIMIEKETLREYTNDQLKKVSKHLNNKVPYFFEYWISDE